MNVPAAHGTIGDLVFGAWVDTLDTGSSKPTLAKADAYCRDSNKKTVGKTVE